jgi:UDP-glucose 4-epimerase
VWGYLIIKSDEARNISEEGLDKGGYCDIHFFNLGTGQGTSVLQLVQAFEEVNNIKIPYEIVDRRPGDIAECYADTSKAERELGWKAKRQVEEMVRDAWRFEKNYKE